MEVLYIIYGRKEGQSRFKPLNDNGDQVTNLMYALVFWGSESIHSAESFSEVIKQIHPTMELEIRSQKG